MRSRHWLRTPRPYNSDTAIITALAIGIGVDFAIHIAERYVQERGTVEPIVALERTVRGTGGALLASAMTTVAGFGILALTLVPSLQRFGIVTGLTIAFAWAASVLVLPSLLVLWERGVGD
ncbi:MAG: MMPL family transporter [Natrialbaceae archaeon]|nr:MMPL family transporter [Natrialbaceae archaeon]